MLVDLFDREGTTIFRNVPALHGTFEIHKAKLWWPYLMHPDPGYLYTLKVSIMFHVLIWKSMYHITKEKC